MWIGLILGVIVGGWAAGIPGALALGFIGWMVGLIMKSQGRAADPVARPATARASSYEEARVARLERIVTELQERVAHLEGPAAPYEQLHEEPAPEPVREPAPVPEPEPIREPDPIRVPEPVREPEPLREPEPVRAPEPAPVPQPAQRSLFDRLLEGNIVAKIGVVILFFGVAFLLKFAYDHGLFPPQMRLLAVAAASAVMFLIGGRLLASHRTYALVLMGGAMGLAYLDVFFALKTFRLITPVAGFGLFALLGVATLALAVRLDARAFAALGLLGGFLAPVLASTGSGQHVLLFSYYLLLNLVILATSWFRSWRELNFIGFLFTFAIGLVWGYGNYRPELFATVEPFLIAFFVLYLAIPILFAFRQPPQLKGVVDGTLIFGVPLTAAMMQAALTRGMDDHVLAWSAFLAAIVYAVLARLLWNRNNMRLLAEAHLALAIVFATVAPYFAFAGYPTFAFWTLEGAAIYWIGCRQRRVLARVFGLALQFAAAGYFWWVTRDTFPDHPVWNERVVGCVLIAMSSLATAWFVRRFESALTDFERALEGWLIAWAGGWLLVAASLAIRFAWIAPHDRMTALLIVIAVVLLAMEYAGRALEWRKLRMACAAHVPLMAAVAFLWFSGRVETHPLQGGGVYAWPLAFAALFHIVHRQLADGLTAWRGLRYRGAWILLAFLATWEAAWRLIYFDYEWVFGIGAAGLGAAAMRFLVSERGVANAARLSGWVIAWSLVWWFAGLHGLIGDHVAAEHRIAANLAMTAGSVLLFELAGRALAWSALRHVQAIVPAAILVAALVIFARHGAPLAQWQAWGWLALFAVAELTLFRQERDGIAATAPLQHVFMFGAVVGLIAWESHWQLDRTALSSAWRYAVDGAILASALALATAGIRRGLWPFATHADAFKGGAIVPLLVLALVWTLVANVGSDAGAAPWSYLPILNPLDLAQLALLAAAVAAVRRGGPAPGSPTAWMKIFGAAAFFWVNALVLRTVHHWADVPFELGALLQSVVAQAALSLLWTATALVAMYAAGRSGSRPLWMAGAALLVVVVAKLFLHDLGNTGTVARIVSFIGVGVFMLLIGYLSPVPPRRDG